MNSNTIIYNYLINDFLVNVNTYSKALMLQGLLILIAGDVLILLIFIFIWRPYVKSLNQNIWRTKGMLSMIPMDVILNNDSLKSAMMNGELVKAVK
jgi:hypothetical protein